MKKTQPPRLRRTARSGLVGALAVTLAATMVVTLAACFPFRPSPSKGFGSPTSEVLDPALAPFYEQDLSWVSCEPEMQCTTAVAPIDWDDPAGATVELALIRHEAPKNKKLGSLFVNPGGPGASGVKFVRDSLDFAVGKPLQEAYDIVGFDPRGVGGSAPVTCFADTAQMDELLYGITPGERTSEAWVAEREATAREFAAACQQNTGAFLAHVDTESAARDLDMLRYAVGDARFNYLGYSYGTLLGATYAEIFPTRVGRMVLDGALDPASSNTEVSLTQAVGFENALRAYVTWCLEQSECPFAEQGSVDSALAQVAALLAQVDAAPLPASGTASGFSADDRLVGADTLVTAIIAPLYDPGSWSYLSDVFVGIQNGDATAALESADWYNGRNADGTYADNSTEAFLSINCLDYPATPDPATWKTNAAALTAAAPIIGPYFGYGETLCANWPHASTRTPAPIVAEGSPDILVIGTTGDPATPYSWAVNLAGELANGHLITYTGEGHTAYNKSNSCVDDAVTDFFLAGRVPAADPKC